MIPKYEITDIQHPENPKLFRIRALRDTQLALVNAGALGGYVENENNLSQKGDCWIGVYARVYENSQIYGNAQIYGNSQVSGNTRIFGEAQIYGRARVFDDSQIFGEAKIYNTAWVSGDARISGNVQVSGDVHVRGDIILIEDMRILGSRGIIITSPDQIYYADGVTAYFNLNGELTVNGSSPDIEHHKMLARLKLS